MNLLPWGFEALASTIRGTFVDLRTDTKGAEPLLVGVVYEVGAYAAAYSTRRSPGSCDSGASRDFWPESTRVELPI